MRRWVLRRVDAPRWRWGCSTATKGQFPGLLCSRRWARTLQQCGRSLAPAPTGMQKTMCAAPMPPPPPHRTGWPRGPQRVPVTWSVLHRAGRRDGAHVSGEGGQRARGARASRRRWCRKGREGQCARNGLLASFSNAQLRTRLNRARAEWCDCARARRNGAVRCGTTGSTRGGG